MSKLNEYGKEELLAELERREKAERPKPLPPEDMDFSSAISNCEEYIEQLAESQYVDEDTRHYIFEATMGAVYGRDVWKWVRSKQG